MNAPTFTITREKHLDHLVRVVPLIVLGYGIQSYLLMQMKGPLNGTTFVVLGIMLVLMIAGFIIYDVKQEVTLTETHLEVNFLGMKKSIPFTDILSVSTTDPKESFGTVLIRARQGKSRFYFVDDVEKVQNWIETRRAGHSPSLAA